MEPPERCPHCGQNCRFHRDGNDLVSWCCFYRIVGDTREPRSTMGWEKDREKAMQIARSLGLRVYSRR